MLVYRDLEYMVNHVDSTKPVNQAQRGYRPWLSLRALPHGAVVATSSTRRAAQVQEQRPDVKIVPIRGNVGTRLKKIADQLVGASGAEIKAVATESGMYALRERRVHVTQEDFEMAVAKVMKKDSDKDMSLKKLWK